MAASSEESGEPLCCCEYVNVKGEKSHVLALLCDCEAVDDTCDRFIRCQPIPTDNYTAVWNTLCDRLRIPSFLGSGAHRLDEVFDPTAVLPIIVIPTSLLVASWHFYLTVVTFLCLPVIALIYFRQVSRVKHRTKFFFSWGLTSVVCIGFVFYVYVVPVLPLTDGSSIIVTILAVFMFLAFLLSKKNPGIVQKVDKFQKSKYRRNVNAREDSAKDREEIVFTSRENNHRSVGWDGNHGNVESVKRNGKHERYEFAESGSVVPEVSTRTVIHDTERDSWCNVCEINKPPRTGHCKVCQHCVQRLDHHCVWIDSCIGTNNHRSFLCSLVLIVLVGILGSNISLQTVCIYTYHHQSSIPQIDCSRVYDDQTSALVFASIVYALLAVSGFAALLLQQCYLISHGITYREYRFQQRTYYSKKFIRNWIQFLCMRKTNHLQIV